MNFEKKANSKAFMFFDRLFRLFICNILTIASMAVPVALIIWVLIVIGNDVEVSKVILLFWIAFAIFIITFPFLILPAIVSTFEVIKRINEGGVIFKDWFSAFRKYYVKSMLIGIIFAIIFGLVLFSIYFYSNVEIVETGIQIGSLVISTKLQNIIIQAGFVVMMVLGLATLLFVMHVPLLITTFPKLKIGDFLRTDLFVTINNFLSTIFLLGCFIICVISFIVFPVWIMFGISLPIMIAIKLTKISYSQLENVDFDKINQIIDDEEKNEERLG